MHFEDSFNVFFFLLQKSNWSYVTFWTSVLLYKYLQIKRLPPCDSQCILISYIQIFSSHATHNLRTLFFEVHNKPNKYENHHSSGKADSIDNVMIYCGSTIVQITKNDVRFQYRMKLALHMCTIRVINFLIKPLIYAVPLKYISTLNITIYLANLFLG